MQQKTQKMKQVLFKDKITCLIKVLPKKIKVCSSIKLVMCNLKPKLNKQTMKLEYFMKY